MQSGAIRLLDPDLYRRGQHVAGLMRWITLLASLVCLLVIWHSPLTRPWACLAVGAGYAACAAAIQAWLRRDPRSHRAKRVLSAVDAAAVGLGAALSGGLESPLWLLLYPHVLAVSVRGSAGLALATGVMDGAIVVGLDALHPGSSLGIAHALTLVLCAVVGSVTGSYLHSIQGRLYRANLELQEKNAQLSETLAAEEASRREQERAQARLHDSEDRYRRLLERIQDGVLIVREEKIVFANDAFAALVGDPRESLVGADYRDFVPAPDRDEIGARYQRWLDTESQATAFEARLQNRRGEVLLVSLRTGSVEFEGVRSVIATVRDITRERRMEADLKAHAERLAALNEIANAVNLSLRIEDILKVAAAEARHLVPFDRLTIALLDERGVDVVAVEGHVGRERAVLPRDAVSWAFRRPVTWCAGPEPAPPHVSQLLATEDVASIATLPLFSKDRVIGCLNLGRVRPEPFSTWDLGVLEPVARHIAIALDNARLVEALRRRSREFESLFEVGRGIVARLQLPELLPLVVRSTNEIMGTRLCLLMLRSGDTLELGAHDGLEPELATAFGRLRLGESLTGWVAEHGEPLTIPDMSQDPRMRFSALAARYGYRSYLCVPLKRGKDVFGTLEVLTREVRHFGHEERDLMAAVAGAAAVALENARLFEDAHSSVRKLAEANRRLEELDRLRREYLRNVSHEFRTPLTVIKGYAEYLLDAGAPEPASLQEVMRIIVESCDRVIDMIETLIEVSRVEQDAARDTLQIQVLDLREVAAASVEGLRHVAARKQIALDLDFPREPLQLEGDSGLMQQVVRKLVDNALKYSSGGTRVVVRGRLEGADLLIDVEDSGSGIAAEHLPRIFDKFYMADGGIARRIGGTGVGLYLVREIVRLHDGRVDVRSHPGQGSVFSVRLPTRLGGTGSQTALA